MSSGSSPCNLIKFCLKSLFVWSDRRCIVDLQDVLNSSSPNKPWAHQYPIRQHVQGRSYATLSVEWSYRIDKPSGFVQPVMAASQLTASRVTMADSKLWDFLESNVPFIYRLLHDSRTLERGDHLVIGAVLSYLLGWCQVDSGFLIPLAALLSRLESLYVLLSIQEGLQRVGERDERLKQVAKWQKTSVIKRHEISEKCLAQLLNLLRQNVPQILVDSQAQALSGVLEHFWPCYTDW